MKPQEIVDYLIKDGEVYIDHKDWRHLYYWNVNRDGYDLAFEIEVTELINEPKHIAQRLLLTDPDSKTTYYTISDSNGYIGNPDELIAKIRHSGVLDGCC